MTDTEIKKALECCATDTCFTNSCPFEDESDGFDISKCTSSLSRIALDLINRQQAEIERLKSRDMQVEVSDMLEKEIKAEAIKEFAERLKGKFNNDADVLYEQPLVHYQIDNLVKEMVGDAE